jgi:hypothetical protein
MNKVKISVWQCCVLVSVLLSLPGGATLAQSAKGMMEVGVAKIDITPSGPIRLSGYLRYGNRKNESEGVLQHLWAKAIAFGNDAQGASIIITVDLAGIQSHMVSEIGKYLSAKTGFNPEHLSICASHTHSGPDMGNSHSMYFDPLLPVDQLGRIALYLDSLRIKLQQVALQALQNRKPSLVSWGEGKVGFALNRRVIKNGKWVGHGKVPDGPVDHAMPMMRVTDAGGGLRAIFVSYACHGTTLLEDINKTHGDWIGEAQRLIEVNHPEAIALVAQGCGGNADPNLRGTLAYATQHGQSIADEVERLLTTPLQSLTVAPAVRVKKIQLPFDHVPDTKEFIEMTKDKGAMGHNAEVHLERLVRGIPLDSTLAYPVEVWTFGNQLAMVFLAGEVVAEYSLRLRKELATKKLWINAYTNDVKAYIPSSKMIPEGGYEVEGNMYYYDHPFHFSTKIEDMIVGTVYRLLPAFYKPSKLKMPAVQ